MGRTTKSNFGFFVIAVLFATYAHGSVIKFEAYPSVLKTNLTSSASMRCSLADTQASSNQIGKRSVTSTSDDIFHISAIYITNNNGDDVASISPYDAPIAYINPGNLQVKGDVSGVSSEGYLELTWSDPSAITLGEFNCEVNTVTRHHHSVLFSSTLELTEVVPTMKDLIAELKEQKKQNSISSQRQQEEISNLKQQVADLKTCALQQIGFMTVISRPSVSLLRGQPVIFEKLLLNQGGGYNNATGIFTCSQTGMYSFSVNSLAMPKKEAGLSLTLNSAVITSTYSYGPGNSVETAAATALIHLQVGDRVQVVTNRPSSFYEEPSLHQGTAFSGFMVTSDCLAQDA